MPKEPNCRLDTPADRVRLSRLLVATTVAVGVGTIVLADAVAYGPPGEDLNAAGGASVALGAFLGLLVAHAGLYVAGAWLSEPAAFTLGYLGAQLAMAVALTRAADGVFSCLFFFVVFGTQAVSYYPRRWPIIVIATSWVGWIAMTGYPAQLNQLAGFLMMLTMSVMVIYLVGFVREAVARRHAAELLAELRAASEELSVYADEVEQAALASERQRMARELHDTLAQGLVGVALQLEAADTYLSADGSPQAKTIVRQALARARETLGEARHAIEGLRTTEAEGPLEAVFQREAKRFTAATGIACELSVDVPDPVHPDVVEQLRRVVTEALTNVARHARASSVEAAIEAGNGALTVTVRDDGVGFDTARSDAGAGHFGLLGLKERARGLGGAFDIESAPELGTTLRFSVPVPR